MSNSINYGVTIGQVIHALNGASLAVSYPTDLNKLAIIEIPDDSVALISLTEIVELACTQLNLVFTFSKNGIVEIHRADNG